ncbi:MAG: hypothetical protein A3B23_01305 [Candidatus Colwellbacteria bacterium RIFCSPLOWO2_01_FULL_48_10]|uniref:Uncharacterized protein n=2 Tax=Bacteria candidate phyla TaxID=1783234 RepID=A0A1F5P1W4_9BACT|nr:MAG: hypothetical protein A2846_05085 [Candidatus Doudnabacteria bacterium RIFCSPHIGHO2_01_FULL_49_9]OGY59573.1 MAG: hypothetical protein A3B23_01305 [Candidatus Colwellbacteria bacterium RIFCSPLOWO2_01_FULL_48_10]
MIVHYGNKEVNGRARSFASLTAAFTIAATLTRITGLTLFCPRILAWNVVDVIHLFRNTIMFRTVCAMLRQAVKLDRSPGATMAVGQVQLLLA